MTRKLNQQPVIDLKTVGYCSIDSDIIFSQLTDSECTRGMHTKFEMTATAAPCQCSVACARAAGPTREPLAGSETDAAQDERTDSDTATTLLINATRGPSRHSIIVVVASAQLDILRQKVSPVAGSGFCVRSDGAPEATVNPTNLTCSVYSDVLLFMDQSKTNCSLRSSAPRPGPHWHAQHHHRGLRQLLGGGYFVG